MTKAPTEKEEKKLVTRVSMETYEALKNFSEGENRWEARVLRRVIKEWLVMKGQAQISSGHHDILTDALQAQIEDEKKHKRKGTGS